MQPMRWTALDETEVEQMHEQVLRILEETGLKVTHAEAGALPRDRGGRAATASAVHRVPRRGGWGS